MKLLKRSLSLLLVLCMLIGYMPMFATAAGPETAATAPENDFYRIVHLDAARKYYSPAEIKTLIDHMAKNDMNQLNLYLLDNQGFRFALDDMTVTTDTKTYDLTPALGDGYTMGDSFVPAPGPNGEQYLTQTEMTDIINHAKSKGIEIVPCINAPGHMGALLNPTITDSSQRETHEFAKFQVNSSKTSIDLNNKEAVAFTLAVMEKYVAYFASQGCKFYHIGADEYAYNGSGSAGEADAAAFVNFLNDAAELIKRYGMTPRAFNDAFKYTTAAHPIDKDYEVCFWQGDSNLFNTLKNAGYKLINTSSTIYWSVGSSYFTREKAVKNLPGFDPKTFYNNEIKENGVAGTMENPAGAMFCIWADRGVDMTGAEVVKNAEPMLKTYASRLTGFGPVNIEIVKGQKLDREFTIEGEHDAAYIENTLSFGNILDAEVVRTEAAAPGGNLEQVKSAATVTGKVVIGNGTNWLQVQNGGVVATNAAEEATEFTVEMDSSNFRLKYGDQYLHLIQDGRVVLGAYDTDGSVLMLDSDGIVENPWYPNRRITITGNQVGTVPKENPSDVGLYAKEASFSGGTTFTVTGMELGEVSFTSGNGTQYIIKVTDGKIPTPPPKPDPEPEKPSCEHKNQETEKRVEATTEQDGHYGKITCKDCGKVLNEGTVIPKVDEELTLNVKEQHKLSEKDTKPSITQEPNKEIATLTVEKVETEVPGEKPDPKPGTGELTQKTELKTGDKFIVGDGTNFIALKGNELVVTTDPAQAETWELGADGSYKSQTKQGQYLHFSTWNATLDLNWNSTVWQLGAQGINANAWYIYLNSGKWGIQAVNDPAFRGVFAYDVFTGNGGGTTPDTQPQPTIKTTYIPVFEGVAPGVTYAEIDGVRYKITVVAKEHEHKWVGGDCVTVPHCEICGIPQPDGQVNPDNHEGPITPANCQNPAYCAACDKYYGEKDPNVHLNTELRGYKAPTKTEPGYSGDLYCKDENKLIEKGHTLPAIGEKTEEIRVDVNGQVKLPVRIENSFEITTKPDTKYAKVTVTDQIEKRPAGEITALTEGATIQVGDGTNYIGTTALDDLNQGTVKNTSQAQARRWVVTRASNDSYYLKDGPAYLGIDKWKLNVTYDTWTDTEWKFVNGGLETTIDKTHYTLSWDGTNWVAKNTTNIKGYTPAIPNSTATIVVNGVKDGVTTTVIDGVTYRIIVGTGIMDHKHNFTIPATCKHPAKCSECEAYNVGGPLDPTNHDGSGVHIKGYVEPTEEKSGYSGDAYCAHCGVLLYKGESLDPRRHQEIVTVNPDKVKTITVKGDVTGKLDETKELDKTIADVKVSYDQAKNESTITVTGKKVGSTTTVINNIRYQIAVTPDDLTNVNLDMKLWITNNMVNLPGDRPNLKHTGHVAHMSPADYPGLLTKDGMVIADILPLRTTATLYGTDCDMIFWKGMLHNASQLQEEHDSSKHGIAPDNSFFGDLFYLVRYNLETGSWQVASNRREGDAGWIDVGSNTPEVYYLQETKVTKEVDTRVVDWGVPIEDSETMSWHPHTYVLLDFAVYTDGLGRTPMMEDHPRRNETSTVAYHCAHQEYVGDVLKDDKVHQATDKGTWVRRIDTIFGYEKEQYEVYMITLTRTSDNPQEKLPTYEGDKAHPGENKTPVNGHYAENVKPYSYNSEGAGEEKIVWTIDEDTFQNRIGRTTRDGKVLGAFDTRPADFDITDRNDKFEIYRTIGGDPIVDYVQIYENQGMLVTYYLRAKETTDSLKVHYRVEGSQEDFHFAPYSVKEGTFFDPQFGPDTSENVGLVHNTVKNYYDKDLTVEHDLTKLMEAPAEYRTGSYTFNEHIQFKLADGTTVEQKNYTENMGKIKEVILYYDLSSGVHYIPLDFGNPAAIDNHTIGDYMGDQASYDSKDKVTVTNPVATTLKYGELKRNGEAWYYAPNKVMTGPENPITVDVTFNIKQSDGTSKEVTEKQSIVFMPATTVYYEESFAAEKDKPANPAVDFRYAQESTCFDYQTNNFGYDPAMAKEVGPSCKTQWETNDRMALKYFAFTGTGVEIYANTNVNTALARVALYEKQADGTMKMKKMFTVDTSMVDGDLNGQSGGTEGQAVKAYNVPIVSIKDLPHGDYMVRVSFNSAHKDEKNQPKAESFFFDGFRVYNTMQDIDDVYTMTAGDIYAGFGSALPENKQKDVSEKGPVFHEMRDLMLAGANIPTNLDYKGVYAGEVAGNIHTQVIDKTQNDAFSAVKLKKGESTGSALDQKVAVDLIDNGPKNEIYLWPGETLVFALTTGQRAQLGIKALDKAVEYKINTDGQQTLNASTDMYYNVTAGTDNKVTIKNTGKTGILSVTRLKLFNAAPPAALSVAAIEDALVTCGYALAAPKAPAEYTVTFDPLNGTAEFTSAVTVNGKLEKLPGCTKPTFRFVGWFDQVAGGNQITADHVFTADTTLYARWEKENPMPYEYTVSFHANGSVTEIQVPMDETIGDRLPAAPVRDGYVFLGWNTAADGSGEPVNADTQISSNLDVYAQWQQIKDEDDDEELPEIEVRFVSGKGIFSKTKTFEIESGEYILAPAVKNWFSSKNVTWECSGVTFRTGDRITYEALVELLGGNVSEDAVVTFTVR